MNVRNVHPSYWSPNVWDAKRNGKERDVNGGWMTENHEPWDAMGDATWGKREGGLGGLEGSYNSYGG